MVTSVNLFFLKKKNMLENIYTCSYNLKGEYDSNFTKNEPYH